MAIEIKTCETCTVALPGLMVPSGTTLLCYRQPGSGAAVASAEVCIHAGDRPPTANELVRSMSQVKEMTVIFNGDHVAPRDIERAITSDPLFEQAYVFGDNQAFAACIVVLRAKRWKLLAEAMGLDAHAEASWRSAPVAALLLEVIGELTSAFPPAARPHAIVVTLVSWTAENNMLTPALELRRDNLTRHFAPDIARVFPGRAAAPF